jgi:hypothetical protein
LDSKYDLKTPTILHFLKRSLCYEFDVEENFEKDKSKLFRGFTKKGFKIPIEVDVTKELEQMQLMLFEMSSVPRPPFEGF